MGGRGQMSPVLAVQGTWRSRLGTLEEVELKGTLESRPVHSHTHSRATL